VVVKSEAVETKVPAALVSAANSELNPEERETPPLREMIMSDFVNAMKEISASVSENAHAIAELRKWNELYGEGGNRKKTTLTYYV
jgi:hypothetical protein